MRMKLIALVSAALLLTGCAASNTDDAFLETIGANYPHLIEGDSRQAVIAVAHAACAAFGQGATGYDVAGVLEKADFDLGESAIIVVAAVDNYCPEHDDQAR